jgi:hypothetical protein
MSYSIRPDRLISNLSKREYAFTKDSDGASLREATRQLQAADRAIVDAANERALRAIGRPLTTRELHAGNWTPDTRSVKQQVFEDATHNMQAVHDPNANPFANRLQELKAKQAQYSHAGFEGRIEVLQAKADQWETARAIQREAESRVANPDVALWLADANTTIALLEVRPDIDQSWVDRAKARRDALAQSGDVEAYKKSTFAWEAERDALKDARAKELDDKARELRAEAKAVRNDETNSPAV